MEPVKSKMMMYRQIMCVALSAVLFNLTTIQTDAKEWAPDRSGRLMIQKYKTVWTNPPKRTPCRESVDGPVLGNGDMKVAIGGDGAHQRFILCKNDMWRLQHGYGNSSPVPFGTMNVNISGLEGASYKVSQDIYKATTEGAYEMGGSSVRVKCYVAATENVFVLELTAKGKPFTVNMSLDVAEGRGSDSTSGGDGKLFWGKRAFTKAVDVESGVAAAWKLLDLKNPDLMGVRPGISFVLKPGEPVILTLAMDSVFDHKNYQERVKKNVEVIDHNKLIKLKQAHKKWWADYYGKSYVCIGDPVIEKQYYLSLYGMGSCSRNPNFPPAIFGWTTMDRPNWLGDYHLNYNHMAPYYGLARANRLEQADPHDTPLLEFMDRAKWHCQEIFGFDGVMYPVGIGPKGIESTYGNARYISRGTTVAENKGLFWGQRTNAAYALVNMAPRWYTTYDLDYGKKIYPFVLQTATFWENYVIWDKANNRYIIDKDSVHEGSGQDMNSCLSLGLVRNALLLALDLSKEMNINADRCDKWNHILKHLSNYTFQEKDGKKVFRYTEKGKAWWRNNTLGIQQIYPAGQIHLDSDLELLAVSKNTIDVMGRWLDSNGSNSFFPAAVRIGYDPAIILSEMQRYCEHTWPNGFQTGNPHAIENLSTVPNTINEMLCMGHKGVLRLFPVWPKDKDASFTNIRCWGAFVVSGKLKKGMVQDVKIVSEMGRDCTIANPWTGKAVRVYRNDKPAETLSGDRITFKTRKGETLVLSQDVSEK